jgi:adenosylhomocysteinase
MYHLDGSQLRVCGKYVRQERNRHALQKTRLIILQHLLTDTEELVNLLTSSGAEIHCLIAKPYSVDEGVFKRLCKKGVRILREPYKVLEESSVLLDLLREAIAKSRIDGKQIVIQEVGGYFASVVSQLSDEECVNVAGVVEDTTFGHRRYESLISNIKVPIFSVARSALKEIEARFVGKAAVTAVEQEFRKVGTSISGRHALVVGYGMIGKNVARSLRDHDVMVSVYDKNDHRNINAFSIGYRIHKKIELIKSADIIFSATGERAISLSDLEMAKDDVILASAGSKDVEFDVGALVDLSVKQKVVSSNIKKYVLPSHKNIYLFRDGTAVNFIIDSVPSEVIDLVFAEILICTILLLKVHERYEAGVIHRTPETYLNNVAKDWLKFINH